MNNLSPRNNTILLLTNAKPPFRYDRYNSTDNDSSSLFANLADGAPNLAQSNAAALCGMVDLYTQCKYVRKVLF